MTLRKHERSLLPFAFVQMMQEFDRAMRSQTLDELRIPRESIMACFEEVGSFWLPHPGVAVTKGTYDGSISKLEPQFVGVVLMITV